MQAHPLRMRAPISPVTASGFFFEKVKRFQPVQLGLIHTGPPSAKVTRDSSSGT